MSHRHLSTLKLKLLRMPDFASYIFACGSEGCKVYNPKMAFVSFVLYLVLYITMTRKRLDYVALEKVLPARFLVLNW